MYGLSALALAFVILSVSLFESASVKHVFGASITGTNQNAKDFQVDYYLPFPGNILPDSPLWGVKALRDFSWYQLTQDSLKRAEIALLFSDKRIGASKILFDKKNPDVGLTALTKSEKYLEVAFQDEETARKRGADTSSFLTKYSLAALKHRQLIDQILQGAPENAKPAIIQTQDYSKNAYKYSRDVLNSKGLPVPKSPFSGD